MQFGLLNAIETGSPAHAFSRVLTASVSLPWLDILAVVLLAGLGGVWWSWLRGGSSVAPEESGADQIELTMLRAVVANLPDLIYVKDAQSRFLLANQATAQAMGAADGKDLLGRTDFDFFPRGTAEEFFADEQKVIQTGEALVSQDERIREKDGRTRWIMTSKVPFTDALGAPIGIIGIGRNITAIKEMEAQLLAAQSQLEFKAAHDSLTGLLNRGAIVEVLEHEFARSLRGASRTAVLLGDLDRFKNVNDAHGHPVGDEVLREVARRLTGAVRKYDSVGRFGGEEFMVVLCECGNADAVSRANHLRRTIADAPVLTAAGPLPMTMSFGVLVNEGRETMTVDEALREVDQALYAAKAGGRNQCRVVEAAARACCISPGDSPGE